MPAIVGPVQVIHIGGGVLQFGDSLFISPKSASKSISGSGAANTGCFVITNNLINANNTLDTNIVDQPLVGNN